MSTLKTNVIQALTTDDDIEFKTGDVTRMKLQSDGQLVFPTPDKITNGSLVLQMVQTVVTNNVTYSDPSGSSNNATAEHDYVDGMTATLTPASTSSRIYVRMIANFGISSSTTVTGILQRKVGSGDWTDDFGASNTRGDTNQSRLRCTARGAVSSGWHMDQMTIDYIDAPNTTSAVSYRLMARGHEESYPWYLNRSGLSGNNSSGDSAVTISTTTLTELAS
jgi:hypothetical protein